MIRGTMIRSGVIRSIMHKAKAREEQAARQARREEIYWEMVWREKQAELQRVQSRAHRFMLLGSRSGKATLFRR